MKCLQEEHLKNCTPGGVVAKGEKHTVWLYGDRRGVVRHIIIAARHKLSLFEPTANRHALIAVVAARDTWARVHAFEVGWGSALYYGRGLDAKTKYLVSRAPKPTPLRVTGTLSTAVP